MNEKELKNLKLKILVNSGQFNENLPKHHVNLTFSECENIKIYSQKAK